MPATSRFLAQKEVAELLVLALRVLHGGAELLPVAARDERVRHTVQLQDRSPGGRGDRPLRRGLRRRFELVADGQDRSVRRLAERAAAAAAGDAAHLGDAVLTRLTYPGSGPGHPGFCGTVHRYSPAAPDALAL